MDHYDMLPSIFEEATIGVIVVDKEGIIVKSNPYSEQLFGYPKNSFEGMPLKALLPHRIRDKHKNYQRDYLKNPRPRLMGAQRELYGLKKDGTQFPLKISLSHTVINGKTYALGFVTDDSLEKRILNELIESQRSLSEAQKMAHIGNFEIDLIKHEEIWSEELFRIFGIPQSEGPISYGQYHHMIHEDDRDTIADIHKKMIREKSGINLGYRIISKNGSIKFLYGKRDVKLDKNGHVTKIFGTIQDITETKRIEEALEQKIHEVKSAERKLLQLNEELEAKVEQRTLELEETINRLLKTNKTLEEREIQLEQALNKEKELNELKSRFVSMASHEFRTPLSTILSSASLISRYTETGQQKNRLKHTDRIKSSVNNLTSILNEFLSLSKIEEGKEKSNPVPIQLQEFCQSILGEIKGIKKQGQTLDFQITSDIGEINSDPRILKNIILNLLSNAIKYSSEEGVIHWHITKESNQVSFEIKDNGIGIPESEQKHLFSRFFRASNAESIKGTGLGLHIVKRYVELLKGHIHFESELGEGTVFKVLIPNTTN